MAASHILRQITYTDENGVEQVQEVWEATQGTTGGVTNQRWYTCAQCRYDYPEDQIVLINGRPYCTVFSCAEDNEERNGS